MLQPAGAELGLCVVVKFYDLDAVTELPDERGRSVFRGGGSLCTHTLGNKECVFREWEKRLCL